MGDMEQIRELVERLLTSNANALEAADNRQRIDAAAVSRQA